MQFLLLILFIFPAVVVSGEPEKTAKYVLDYHLVSIRDYARYQDTTSLKTLFASYPKEFDKEKQWPKVMKMLESYEFKTFDAKYTSFDISGKPIEIRGNVAFVIGNKNHTDEVRLKKNARDSVTEWKMENKILETTELKSKIRLHCFFSIIICLITGQLF